MCVYIYIYIYIYTCACVFIYVSVSTCIRYVLVRVCIQTHAHVHAGAEDLANMFQFKVDCNEYYCGARNMDEVSSCMYACMCDGMYTYATTLMWSHSLDVICLFMYVCVYLCTCTCND